MEGHLGFLTNLLLGSLRNPNRILRKFELKRNGQREGN
jgi:hypothetical protein